MHLCINNIIISYDYYDNGNESSTFPIALNPPYNVSLPEFTAHLINSINNFIISYLLDGGKSNQTKYFQIEHTE